MTENIHVFGDSHSEFFFSAPFFVGRMRLKAPLGYRVVGRSIHASSVAGFRPGKSTLRVKEVIWDALPEAQRMVLAFGQVDLELGYYYRLAIKGEDTSPDDYARWLAKIYEEFLEDLLRDTSCDIALKGVNLTCLAPEPFAARYVARIVTEELKMTPDKAVETISPFILSENAQNRMHINFNAQLRQIAQKRGIRYFDLNSGLANEAIPGLSRDVPSLSDHFRPAKFDHHLADTISVRRMHYEALGRTYNLIP